MSEFKLTISQSSSDISDYRIAKSPGGGQVDIKFSGLGLIEEVTDELVCSMARGIIKAIKNIESAEQVTKDIIDKMING